MVDGVAIGSDCETKGVSQPASSKILTCTKSLSTYVSAGSTISIRSYWNATTSWRDQVQDDVTWSVGYKHWLSWHLGQRWLPLDTCSR